MNQNYLEIDFEKVKGYKKLSENAKGIFQRVYRAHNSMQGQTHKFDWVPISVKECKTHLEVRFHGGEWLRYLPNGTWY